MAAGDKSTVGRATIAVDGGKIEITIRAHGKVIRYILPAHEAQRLADAIHEACAIANKRPMN